MTEDICSGGNMKKIIIMNLLLIQIVIFSKKVIVIDQKMFRTEKDLYYEKSEKRNVIRLEYYSEECDITKFLEEDTQGSIVYDGKKYKEISEIYEDYNNLEQKSYSRKADIVRKSYGVLFSKNKRYKVWIVNIFLNNFFKVVLPIFDWGLITQ
jgi:hypothetical protein